MDGWMYDLMKNISDVLCIAFVSRSPSWTVVTFDSIYKIFGSFQTITKNHANYVLLYVSQKDLLRMI